MSIFIVNQLWGFPYGSCFCGLKVVLDEFILHGLWVGLLPERLACSWWSVSYQANDREYFASTIVDKHSCWSCPLYNCFLF